MPVAGGALQGSFGGTQRVKVSDIQLGILVFMLNFIVEKADTPHILDAFWAVNTRRDGFID